MEENVLTQQEPETVEVVQMPQAQEQQMPEMPQQMPEVPQQMPEAPQQMPEAPQPLPPLEQSEPVQEPVQEPKKPAQKQKKEKKPRKTAQQNNGASKLLSPAKIGGFIMFLLQAAIVALCGIQLVIWGISIAAHNADYIQAIMGLDYINIVMIAIMLIFIAVMVGTLICSILSILKKNAQFVSLVTTYLAFYIFCKFIPTVFDGRALLVSQLNFYMLNFVAILVLAYAVLRLIDSDIRTRIVPFIFTLLVMALAIAMFVLQIGDFVRFDIGQQSFTIAQLNPERYFQLADDYFSAGDYIPVSDEATLFVTFYYDDFFDLDEFYPAVLIAVQFVAIMVAKMLPYMALSLLGYLVYGLLGKNYEQYYNLLCCKKVMRMMFTTAILGLLCVGFMYLCPMTSHSEGGYLVTVNVLNCGLTVGLCIVGMILSSMPWKIYNKVYKRKYKIYKANEGRTQYGTSAM